MNYRIQGMALDYGTSRLHDYLVGHSRYFDEIWDSDTDGNMIDELEETLKSEVVIHSIELITGKEGTGG